MVCLHNLLNFYVVNVGTVVIPYIECLGKWQLRVLKLFKLVKVKYYIHTHTPYIWSTILSLRVIFFKHLIMRYLDFAKSCHIQWNDSGAPPWHKHHQLCLATTTWFHKCRGCLSMFVSTKRPLQSMRWGKRWQLKVELLHQLRTECLPGVIHQSHGVNCEKWLFLPVFVNPQFRVELRTSQGPRYGMWLLLLTWHLKSSQIIANLQPKVFPPTKAFHNSRTCCESCWSIRTSLNKDQAA